MNNFLIMFVEKVWIVWISEEENRFFVHFVRRDGLGFVRRENKAPGTGFESDATALLSEKSAVGRLWTDSMLFNFSVFFLMF